MTIQDPGDIFFPYNAVRVLELNLKGIDEDIQFQRRKVNLTDRDQTIGIIPQSWAGRKGSREIGGREASIQVYRYYIQSLIVAPDPAVGLRLHAYFAKRIRELLDRSDVLEIALSNLETTDPNGVKEKVTQFYTGNQEFHTHVFDGRWAYLSTLEFTLDTEILN